MCMICRRYTQYCVFEREAVRTNIEIDNKLMNEAIKLSGLKTKRETVELGLRTLVRLKRQEEFRRHRGKLDWVGDLDEMRTST